MNTKHTWAWFLAAAALFAFIFFFERHWGDNPAGPAPLLPGFKADQVSGLAIRPAGQFQINLARSNALWWITQPLHYPADGPLVNGLLTVLEKLVPAATIERSELKQPAGAEVQFGLDNPQIALDLQLGDVRRTLKLGLRSAPGSEVFAQVVGREAIYVLDAELLKLLPTSASAWRDAALLDSRPLVFDGLRITNAGRVIRLQQNPTNQGWRLALPLEVRADGPYLQAMLKPLQDLRAVGFVPEDGRSDLDALGLQPPELSIAFALGEANVAVLQFGRTNSAGLTYARRDDLAAVLLVPSEPLAAWKQDFFAFRDRQLLAPPAGLAALEFQGAESFTLEAAGSNQWRVAGEKFPVDAARVQELFFQLGGLEIISFEKDVVLPPELGAYGLTSAVRRIVFKLPAPATNGLPLQLEFGATNGGAIYVRRSDESSIYGVRLAEVANFPVAGWQLRDRRVWSFTAAEVARLAVRKAGWARECLRTGSPGWALAPGSQGVLDTDCVEELAGHLGQTRALPWVARGAAATNDARFGFATNSLQLAVELKSGSKLELQFGGYSPAAYAYARVLLEGEPWVFEFPRALHVLLVNCLGVPSGAP